MKIIRDRITLGELRETAINLFGDMIKAVVDVDRELIAIDAELHSDLEAMLLQDGSKQNSLWGINFYPDMTGDDFIEFDSLINIRPSRGNKIRGVTDEKIRKKIAEIAAKRVSG